MTALPIEEIVGDITAHLSAGSNALVIAPPGAGKSTFLPLQLLAQPWAKDGQIILLQPRRVAVRSVAGQLARLVGQPLGQRVGYQMRDDRKMSHDTQLLVMTQGVYRRRLLADPELVGVQAVLFDEYHERSVDGDFCLALSRDVQASLRPDLKLVVMSATLNVEAIVPALPGFALFQSEGRSFPIETQYRPPAAGARLVESVVSGVRHALDAHSGSVLCFLPGQGEIRAVHRTLEDSLSSSIEVAMLFGGLKDREQMEALSPPKPSTRKVILATDIAETSLTVPNVHAVVDSGFRRIPVFDERLGVTQLKKQRASKDRLDQRRGRAGRVAPGLCIRLWPQEEMRAVRSSAAPDVETQDLTDIVLACADWGVSEIATLPWTSPPPARAVLAAQTRLQDLGLLDGEARITPRGRLAARLPMDADLAALLIAASGTPEAQEAALLCAWLSDGGAKGQGCIDLEAAVNDLAYKSGRHSRLQQRAQAWLKMVRAAGLPEVNMAGESPSAGIQLALTRPHLIAKRRSGQSGGFKLAAGRGAFVEGNTDLQAAPYLVVGSAILAGEDVRITSAWPFTQNEVDSHLEGLFQRKERIIAHEKHGRMQIEQALSIGDIVIRASREDVTPGPKLAQMLFETVRAQGLDAVPLPPAFHALKARAGFALAHGGQGPDLSGDALLESADIWLMPLLERAPSLSALPAKALFDGVVQMQDYQVMRALDRFAPTHFTAPADVRLAIDYSASPAPNIAAKLQAFMGLKEHPTIANGRVALLVTLLSPAGRPLQTTRDLPGFWAGSYADVRRDMRGRYPKHPWPEDPANAQPTLKTKNRMKR